MHVLIITENILQALQWCTERVKSADATPAERAVALAEPAARVEQAELAEPVAPEAKAREETREEQPAEPAARAARTTTTILMRIR